MKKLLVFLLVVSMSLGVEAQEFNGIKIQGTADNFISAMKAKGYTYEKKEKDLLLFKGRIAGKEVDIFASLTPSSRQVHRLSIYFPERSTWSTLKGEYLSLLDVLRDKYGEPDESYSIFLEPYDEGDGYELTGVKVDKCAYMGTWEDVGNMKINIDISKVQCVRIAYMNNKLTDVADRERKNQIKDVL